MRESKMLEALALVELYPGDEFRIAGSDTVYYIGEKYGIFTKNNDVISNEKLVTVLSNPSLIKVGNGFIESKFDYKVPCNLSKREKDLKSTIYVGG